MTLKPEDLTDFLGRHASSPKELELNCVPSGDEGIDFSISPGTVRSVVVDLFVFLGEKLQLNHFRLDRYIGIPKLEYYKADNDAGTDHTRLKAISDFICHKAAFPFPDAAEVHGHPQWALGGLLEQQDTAAYNSRPPDAEFQVV